MGEPISMAEARAQLRLELDDTERDVDVARFIRDAREWVEDYTGHLLVRRTVTESFVGRGPAKLAAWPIAATAPFSVTYVDVQGASASVTGARLDVTARPARVLPAGGTLWPFLRADQAYSVTVEAGYATADDMPGNFRRAMLLLIGAYDIDREGGAIMKAAEAQAKSLCRSKRRMTV